MSQPVIEAFFDEPTNTISYLVGDPATHIAAVIDPVLDFDLASGEADTRSAERILAFAKDKGWDIAMVLETHAHADHLSAAPFIKAQTGASIGIGAHIRDVQKIFRPVFAMDDLAVDGSDFDRLFVDGERFRIGELEVEVMHVPGHTPADVAYLVADAEPVAVAALIAGLRQTYGRKPGLIPVPGEIVKIAAGIAGKKDALRRLTQGFIIDPKKLARATGWSPEPDTLAALLRQREDMGRTRRR